MSDINVVAVAACTRQGEADRFVVQVGRFHPRRDDAEKRREVLAGFLTVYFPFAKKAAGLTS
ncbi:hypothetical protein ACFCYH_09585 [Streptomyces sp. NPDC056400]|uniref:hypothetical protein n=1 Tax=Streptomyces sp. NPDC056400 TaxID=3345808 RepID=UPI0035E00617